MPPKVFGRLDDELLPVVEPVVVEDPLVVDVVPVPVVVDVSELPVVPPVDVPVVVPVVPVVELVPVVPVVELLPLESESEDGSANATAASGRNARQPAARRLEAAASRAWGITRRSPPLF
ncbi:hypothetical protein A7R75_04050 [Mycolicibacterium llatzerense]|nr:hypothetical protein [Mycolicibacterium llatzerense]